MQGGIHYFGRGVPLLSLLEAVIHEDSEGTLNDAFIHMGIPLTLHDVSIY